MGLDISVTKVAQSKFETTDLSNLGFGKVFTDHMFIADYKNGAWTDLRIVPFEHIPMHPAMSSIHYGQSIFEGLKAKKDSDGNIIVFRPDMNIKRMNRSAKRMAMPEISEEIFFEGLNQLLKLENKWIPEGEESSLYIRPFMFSTDEFVGIRRSDTYKFIIFTCPVGAYYSAPVKVYASTDYVRAFPKGTGYAKTAGNYARAILPAEEVMKKGYNQILWLDGIEFKYLQEIGTMNIFVVIDGVVLTPSLDEGTILPGVTRDSVISILKDLNIPIEERKVSIDELIEASQNGTLEDAFGAGTAATISFIESIGYKDLDLKLPAIEDRSVSNQLKNILQTIKDGKSVDKFGWMYKINIEQQILDNKKIAALD